jgi:hypothetical protein
MNVCCPRTSTGPLRQLIQVVKLIFSFLLSYPLAGLLKRIPDKSPWQKNAFIIA